MRVAVITRRFFRAGGGAEGYAVALVRELASRHEVHVFSQQSDQPVPGVTYHTLRFLGERPRWLNQWVFAFSSWWQTRRGFDVVHSHENTWHGDVQTIHVRPLRFNLFQGLTGWRLGLRWFKVCTSPRLLTYVYLEAARFKPKPGRTVVAASALLRDDCMRAYPKALVQVVAPGVDRPEHSLAMHDARGHLGLPTSGGLMLFVANDFARKGLDTLLKAMALLSSDLHLAIVGDLQQKTRYESVAQQCGVRDRVHFLGTLGDMSAAYSSADVLVHPTLEDSYAMVVLEAMAYGLPTVVSGLPWCGIAADLTDGQHALLLADPQNAEALAHAIRRVFEDSDLRASLHANGLAFADAHDWSHAALKYERFYERYYERARSQT